MEDVIYESWLKCYNNINFITQNVKELHLPQSSSRNCCENNQPYTSNWMLTLMK